MSEIASATSPALQPAAISPVEDIIADVRAGRMVILVDEEDRENEGDLLIAAEHVSADAINFMAKHARGLICLTLTREHCERLNLPPMARKNGTRFDTAFTVSIEAAEGVTTGISAADRARTISVAVAKGVQPTDLVQPGHIFPIQAVDGGVLVRAGHTEAGCDLTRLAGLTPACVICEVMKDDGTMARLPDLQIFAAQHGLKIGTIADLIQYRSAHESLIERVGNRPLHTHWGEFTAHIFRDCLGKALHLALVKGQWAADEEIPVRVHEPLSVLDVLDAQRGTHSWSLHESLRYIDQHGKGVMVLLNCGESGAQLLAQIEGRAAPSHAPARGNMDLRTYGIGAQILCSLGVARMALLGQPRRLPSMAAGYRLEITRFIPKD